MKNPLSLIPFTRPGALLRELRAERGWTLSEVSQRTGLTISTLSKIENHRTALTYDKMVQIATGLNVDIGVLFARATPTADEAVAPEPAEAAEQPSIRGRRSVTRAGEERVIETRNLIQLYPAADLLNKQLVPVITEVKARSRNGFGELLGHPGEEYVMVLEGVLELHSEFYAPVLLRAGDSIYFDSSMAHGYVAVGEERCKILSVLSTVEWGVAAPGGAMEHDEDGPRFQIARAS